MIRALVLCLLLLAPATARAQQPSPPVSFPRALAIETLGGAAGSLAGLGALSLSGACDPEDIACILRGIGAVTTLGATAGTYVAGRLGGTSPSGPGALGGAVVGLLAAAGTAKLAEEAGAPERGVVVTFALTQGLFSALGSRLLSR